MRESGRIVLFMGSAQGAADNRENEMTINAMKFKFLGKTSTLFRVLDASGEVLQVLETKEEAEAWIAARA